MKIIRKHAALFAMCSAVMVLGGCGEGGDKKAATQVAAKVNKTEISVHQINSALSRAGNLKPEQIKPASREVLDKLVDQQLLVQKAMEKKLDRDPRIMQALEASRQQILAQAYIDQLIATVSKPTNDEVAAYFNKHPELFSERRIFRFQQVNVAAGRDRLPELQKTLDGAKSMSDIVADLKEKGIQYSVSQLTEAAEQIPLELLPRLSQMKNGQIAVIPGNNNILLVQLVESKAAPVALTAATPAIEQFLTNQRRSELATKEMKQLKADAKIEYVGEFAKGKDVLAAEAKAEAEEKAKIKTDADEKAKAAAAAKASAAAKAEEDAKARAELKAKADAVAKADKDAGKTSNSKPSTPPVAKDSISKGLSGL